MSRHADEAAGLLQHYFRVLFRAAGREWTGDNHGEMAQLVDHLDALIVERIREVAGIAGPTEPSKLANLRAELDRLVLLGDAAIRDLEALPGTSLSIEAAQIHRIYVRALRNAIAGAS